MALIKRFIGQIGPHNQYAHIDELIKCFHQLEKTTEFPFDLALRSYHELEKNTDSEDELMLYMLEDIIVSSIYATFYEEILAALKDNQDVALKLIESFADDADTREQVISTQAQSHVNYIENEGYCSGCSHCENHEDVRELIGAWQRRDITFFARLYIGMQTIQYAMEYLLYDVCPLEPSILNALSRKNILDFRKYAYDFAEKKLTL